MCHGRTVAESIRSRSAAGPGQGAPTDRGGADSRTEAGRTHGPGRGGLTDRGGADSRTEAGRTHGARGWTFPAAR